MSQQDPSDDAPVSGSAEGSLETGDKAGEAPDAPSFDNVLTRYFDQVDGGQDPDPATFVKQYPQHQAELRSFFRNHFWMAGEELPEPASLCGQTIGSYQVISELARGGMGVVYRAKQNELHRDVAIKVISTGVLAGDEERQRFRQEAEAVAKLDHPGIIAIYDIGQWNGHEYYSMPLIEGPSLNQFVGDLSLSQEDVARMVRDIARAVGQAHQVGIVHRDLKPENVLIKENDCPVVVDFGLAKWQRDGATLTRTGQLLGTPHYMSPEQARAADDVGASADIYSLGAILFALLTGVPPHQGENTAEILNSVLCDDPFPPRSHDPGIARDLDAICMQAMSREPERRYQSGTELADELDRFLDGEPVSAGNRKNLFRNLASAFNKDTHGKQFQPWHTTLMILGSIIFATHLTIFGLIQLGAPHVLAYWVPRALMFLSIAGTIYHVRGGTISPRRNAERPVWSIWIGYLSALAVINVLIMISDVPQVTMFPLACALSGFAFIAMAGHIWAGSALIGVVFFLMSPLAIWYPEFSPLMFGSLYFFATFALSQHYRRASRKAALSTMGTPRSSAKVDNYAVTPKQ